MTIQVTGYFILGMTRQGKKFRPSDWADRLASSFGQFDACHRIHYHPMVMPVRLNNQPGLFVAAELANSDPAIFDFILDFANCNTLQIEDNIEKDEPTITRELSHVA